MERECLVIDLDSAGGIHGEVLVWSLRDVALDDLGAAVLVTSALGVFLEAHFSSKER